MKVYLLRVTRHLGEEEIPMPEPDDAGLIGIFSSMEKAKEAAQICCTRDQVPGPETPIVWIDEWTGEDPNEYEYGQTFLYEIEPFEIDEMP